MDELASAHLNVPDSFKNLQACMNCKLILAHRQWTDLDQCPNCKMARDTTPDFKGIIGIMYPNESWVARWNLKDKSIPGNYAIHLD